MKYMTGNEIRKAYLQFFKSKEHLILHSFPLIPENDPSLLLIGAGMAQLFQERSHFLGLGISDQGLGTGYGQIVCHHLS